MTESKLLGSRMAISKNAIRVLNSEKIVCLPTSTLELKSKADANYTNMQIEF